MIEEIRESGCDVPSHYASAANRLDLFYMGSRYPDTLGGADPSKVLQKSDALLAVEQARNVFDYAADLVTKPIEDNVAPE